MARRPQGASRAAARQAGMPRKRASVRKILKQAFRGAARPPPATSAPNFSVFPSPHGFAQPLFNLPESFERLPLERFTLAKRGLDDAGAKSNEEFNVYDINFREVLDTVVDGAIYLRALGLGDWDVHGWVRALQDIPRAGHGAGMAT